MKKQSFLLIAILSLTLCASAREPEPELAELSALLQEGSTPGVILSEDDRERLEELMPLILPHSEYIGADKHWTIRYHDNEESDFFQVDLRNVGEEHGDRFMWFHILYLHERPSFYGSEDFGDYRGMGYEDVHYFILVGSMEIRAIADDEAYKSDEAIKGMLHAFRLEQIENL